MPKIKTKEIVEHKHKWDLRANDLSAEYCVCGYILVSRAENDRRQEDWDQYWKMCDTTRARYVRVEMARAIKEKDFNKIKKIREAIKKECEVVVTEFGEEHPIPRKTEVEEFKPHFPEPTVGRYEIKDNDSLF